MIALQIAGTVLAALLGLLGVAGTMFGAMLFDARKPEDSEVFAVFGSMIAVVICAGVGIWLAWANWNGGANPAVAAWQLLPIAPLIVVVIVVRRVTRRTGNAA